MRSTCRSERTPRSRCHWRKAVTSPLPSRRERTSEASARTQSPLSSAARSAQRLRRRRGRARRTTYRTDGPTGGDVERVVRSWGPALRAVVEARRPAGDREGAQQVGVEDEARVVLAAAEGAQGAGEQQVLLRRRLVLLGEPLSGLDHDRGGGVDGVVPDDGLPVGGHALGLGHGVEVAALVALDVDDHERLESRTEPGLGAPHALGDGADLATLLGEEGDDPVGLAQRMGAQHDGLVTVEGHVRHSLPPTTPGRVRRPERCRATPAGPRGAPSTPCGRSRRGGGSPRSSHR